jgi:K+-sensing histidine kinase KdpD
MKYVIAAGGSFLVVALLLPIRSHINTTPVALAFLLVVLFTATRYGRNPAIVASIVSALCFNFFFTEPYYTLSIADPQNWIAFATFLITSLVAGNLSTMERMRAEEVQRLYAELREAFEKVGEAEALKKSEQLKSALLDAVTHDLRTPLTTIKAAVTAALDDTPGELDDEGRKEMLEVVNVEVDRLNHLLENLIEMAKIEAGAMEPRRSWSTIDEIISIALTRSSEMTSRHTIKLNIEKNLPPLRVDEKAIAEVLYALIDNATKYSSPHSEITIAAKHLDSSVELSVQDEGIGIPPMLREKVFDKFFRGNLEGRSAAAGLGMGLAIARAMIEAHKGKIWIDPSVSSGTRVCFLLPLESSEAVRI